MQFVYDIFTLVLPNHICKNKSFGLWSSASGHYLKYVIHKIYIETHNESRCPDNGGKGEEEDRERDGMTATREIWKEFEKNGEQQQKIGVGKWKQRKQ